MTANKTRRSRRKVSLGVKLISWAIFAVGACSLVIWLVLSRGEWMSERLLFVAEAKWQQNDYLGAIRDYEKVIEAYPKSSVISEAYYWKGVGAFLYLDDHEMAVASFKKSIQIGAEGGQSTYDLSAREYLAQIYDKKLQQPIKAIETYEGIMAQSGDKDQVLESRFRIGELYYQMGDMVQARVEWDMLVDGAPKSTWAPAALYRKGGSYFVTGACHAAIEIYTALYTEYPEDKNSGFAKFRAANCLEMEDRFTEALSLYKSLESHYPDQGLIQQKIKRLRQLIHQTS